MIDALLDQSGEVGSADSATAFDPKFTLSNPSSPSHLHLNPHPPTTMASPSTMCSGCLRSVRSALPKSTISTRFLRPSRTFTTSPPAATQGAPLYLNLLAPAYKSRQSITLRSPRPSPSKATHSSFRGLSSTPVHQKAIHNPRTDENGEEMDIEITPRAANVSLGHPVRCTSSHLLSIPSASNK
jgi:hypothetical protein